MSHATDLERRILDLEKRTRRQSTAIAGLLALLTAGCLTAAVTSHSDVLRAESFELVDRAGKLRGELTAGNGPPRLQLFSEEGGLAVLAAGPSLHREPPSTDPALASLFLGASGTDTFVEHEVHREVVLTRMDADDSSAVFMASKLQDGRAGSVLQLLAEGEETLGTTTIATTERGGTVRVGFEDTGDPVDGVFLGVEDGRPELRLQALDGKSLFQAP